MAEIKIKGGHVVLIDDADIPLVSQYKLYRRPSGHISCYKIVGYAEREAGIHRRTFDQLHTMLWGPRPDGHEVDHKNRNPLDNRRENLRLATKSQQQANAGPKKGSVSKYKGVGLLPNGKWIATLIKDGKCVYSRRFKDEVDAATAYNFVAEEHFGEFAYMNTPCE